MPGAVVQLISPGPQDNWFSSDPTLNPFEYSYNQTTRYAIESIEQTYQGSFNFDGQIHADIQRVGDLVGFTLFEFGLQAVTPANGDTFQWVDYVGFHIIKNVSLEIGGTTIIKHYGEYMVAWTELTTPVTKRRGLNDMIGDTVVTTTYTTQSSGTSTLEVLLLLLRSVCRIPRSGATTSSSAKTTEMRSSRIPSSRSSRTYSSMVRKPFLLLRTDSA